MGQQHRKQTKRRRRLAYIKRQKEIRKNSRPSASVPLAKKISQPEVVEEKVELAQEEAAKKAPAKKAPAKKAPAKKAPAKKAEAPAAEATPETAAE